MGKTKKGGKSPLGEKIAKLTRERGFSKPSDFAHQSGINLRTFNDLIYGYTKILPDSLSKVCAKLGVEPWELLRPGPTPYEPHNETKRDSAGRINNSVRDKLGAREGKMQTDQRQDNKSPTSETFEKNIHSIASDIANQVLTALKSEPVVTSKEHEELIGVIRGMSGPDARKWLKTIRSTPHAILPQDKGKSRTPR